MTGRGLYLMRHGESEANVKRIRSGGDSDIPLTDRGRGQAWLLASVLAAQDPLPGLVLASPLGRTMETARIISEGLDAELLQDDGFNERLIGAWNGMSYEESEHLFRTRVDPPGGETGEEFRDRVVAAFQRHAAAFDRWPVVVSSKGVSRIIFEAAGTGRSPLEPAELVRVRIGDEDKIRFVGIDSLYADGVAA